MHPLTEVHDGAVGGHSLNGFVATRTFAEGATSHGIRRIFNVDDLHQEPALSREREIARESNVF